MPTLDEIADELYGIDPDEFMAARTAAVATAKADGDKALAKQVGALRKPTRSAWLVNLLVRTVPERLEPLADLAARLAEATSAADVAALREAGTERTRLVSDLARYAVQAGRDQGYDGGEGVRGEVVTTLQAAVADPEVLAQVTAGRVEKAQVYAGFGFGVPGMMSPLAVVADEPADEPELETEAPQPEPEPAPEPEPELEPEAEPELEAEPEPEPEAEPEPAEDPQAAKARQQVERWTALLEEAVEVRVAAEAASTEADEALDRASQEVADLRGELKAAEAAELEARDASTRLSEELHDARTAEQQAKAALERAKRAAGR